MTSHQMLALLKVATRSFIYDGNTARGDISYLQDSGYITVSEETGLCGLTEAGMKAVNAMHAAIDGKPLLRLVFGTLEDGQRIILARVGPEVNIDDWLFMRRSAFKTLNITRVDVETVR